MRTAKGKIAYRMKREPMVHPGVLMSLMKAEGMKPLSPASKMMNRPL